MQNYTKIIIKVLVFLLLPFLLTSCADDKLGLILFNSVPINQNNALHDKKVFETGTKIYYLFIAPERMNDDYIRVQIFKMTDKAPLGGYDVVRTKDYRLMKDERYYHTNYFVLHESGRYYMQVFSHSNFTKPVAINDFYVR